jgi:hypothetical protein
VSAIEYKKLWWSNESAALPPGWLPDQGCAIEVNQLPSLAELHSILRLEVAVNCNAGLVQVMEPCT